MRKLICFRIKLSSTRLSLSARCGFWRGSKPDCCGPKGAELKLNGRARSWTHQHLDDYLGDRVGRARCWVQPRILDEARDVLLLLLVDLVKVIVESAWAVAVRPFEATGIRRDASLRGAVFENVALPLHVVEQRREVGIVPQDSSNCVRENGRPLCTSRVCAGYRLTFVNLLLQHLAKDVCRHAAVCEDLRRRIISATPSRETPEQRTSNICFPSFDPVFPLGTLCNSNVKLSVLWSLNFH